MTRVASSRLLWATIILLLAMLSRTLIVNRVHIVQDEARSILRSFGTISEIIAWQPLDWPPLYNILLGGWQALVDPHPAILRLFSVLIFLPGAAFTYHIARKLFHSEQAGRGTMIAYSALGYSVFLSSFLRGYVIVLALFPALLLLTIRYFDHPSLRRALALAAVIALMYYTTYTAAFAFVIAGVYTLIVYRREVWRWWLPALAGAMLALPDLLFKLTFFQDRVEESQSLTAYLAPPLQALTDIMSQYAGQAVLIWLLLSLVALILLFRRYRPLRTIWLIGWVLAAPVTVYALVSASIWFIYTPRYVWWGLLGIALVIGGGLAYLPQRIWTGSAVLMLALMFVPLPLDVYREDYLPYEEVLSWLRAHAVPGDVLIVDPQFCIVDCGRGDAWVYYFNYYLQDAVQLVDEPGDYPRVWYLKVDGEGWHDQEMEARIRNGRLGGKFVGPWNMLMRLYEAPPDPQGIPFANGLRFHGFQIVEDGDVLLPPFDIREYSAVRLRLWWSADRPLDAEFSISTTILADRNQQVLAQTDGPPHLIHLTPNASESLPTSMTEWEPGQYYVEERNIQMPPLPTWYDATLYLIVYQWWDGARIAAPETDADRKLAIADMLVMGW